MQDKPKGHKFMPKILWFLSILFFFNGCSSVQICNLESIYGASNAEASEAYATVQLEKPSSQEAIEYLGLTGENNTFVLEEIRATVLVIEVFSVHCRHCLGAAKHFQGLYKLIQEKGLSGSIKIIGVGMENSDPDLNSYRKKFGVVFPLIADLGNKAYRILETNKVAIPHFLVLRRDDNGRFKTVYSKSRETRKAQDLFQAIVGFTGLSLEGTEIK
jgi:hypothetical protein